MGIPIIKKLIIETRASYSFFWSGMHDKLTNHNYYAFKKVNKQL